MSSSSWTWRFSGTWQKRARPTHSVTQHPRTTTILLLALIRWYTLQYYWWTQHSVALSRACDLTKQFVNNGSNTTDDHENVPDCRIVLWWNRVSSGRCGYDGTRNWTCMYSCYDIRQSFTMDRTLFFVDGCIVRGSSSTYALILGLVSSCFLGSSLITLISIQWAHMLHWSHSIYAWNWIKLNRKISVWE